MMNIDTVVLLIITFFPSISAVITSFTALGVQLKKYKELRKDMKERVQADELKQKLEVTLSECRELKKTLKEAVEEYTKIKK